MNRKRTSNIKIVAFFAGFVVLLLLVSFLIKFTSLLTKSKFNGENRFTLAVLNTNDTKNTTILSFSPQTHELSLLDLSGQIPGADEKQKVQFLKRYLEVPIDGYIVESYAVEDNSGEDLQPVVSRVSKFFFSYANIKTDLTPIDTFRIYLYAKSVPVSGLVTNEDVISPAASMLALTTLDRQSAELFSDSNIVNEKLSIQIVNGTGVVGLGTRIARLISNTGGDVVSVITADTLSSASSIRVKQPSTYTANKYSQLLGFPVLTMQKKEISDMIIIFGTDTAKALAY